MLKKQVVELRELNINNQSRNEELEQYGRRLCLCIDSVPTAKDESSDDVLEFTKSLFQEAKVAGPDTALDRAHSNGPSYTDRITSKKCTSIGSRTNLKSGFKVKLNLTKSRFNLLRKANSHVMVLAAMELQNWLEMS